MLNMLNATEDGRIENGIRKKGKFGYIMSRLFPSIENKRTTDRFSQNGICCRSAGYTERSIFSLPVSERA